MTTCLECNKPAIARQLCKSHYDAARRSGTLPPKLVDRKTGRYASADRGAPSPESYAANARWHDEVDAEPSWHRRNEMVRAEQTRLRENPDETWEPNESLYPQPGIRRAPVS